MAETAAHVTMLQRSPSYVVSRPGEDRMANRLRRVLPAKWAYALIRWRNILGQQYIYNQARKNPARVKEMLLKMVREQLGPDFDVDTHFTPAYDPWTQRLCLVPDADLFSAIRQGRASVVTDQIETLTPEGIRLKSGTLLEADIIIAATGLELEVLGGLPIRVDGRLVDPGKTFNYKGFMFSDVPNLASVFGYINASWTLKADLIAVQVCRLLNRMKKLGADECRPVNDDPSMPEMPWFDFSSGYIQRGLPRMPKLGPAEPWIAHQNYLKDRAFFSEKNIEDGVMRFSKAKAKAPAQV
jgi:monooxygenase